MGTKYKESAECGHSDHPAIAAALHLGSQSLSITPGSKAASIRSKQLLVMAGLPRMQLRLYISARSLLQYSSNDLGLERSRIDQSPSGLV